MCLVQIIVQQVASAVARCQYFLAELVGLFEDNYRDIPAGQVYRRTDSGCSPAITAIALDDPVSYIVLDYISSLRIHNWIVLR